jgi:hypothetical protein
MMCMFAVSQAEHTEDPKSLLARRAGRVRRDLMEFEIRERYLNRIAKRWGQDTVQILMQPQVPQTVPNASTCLDSFDEGKP